MANRIEELYGELAESVGGQQQFKIDQQLQQMNAERDWMTSPEGKKVLGVLGGLALLGITRGRSGGKNVSPSFLDKTYGAVGKDFRKFIDPVTSRLSSIFGRSGLGVGADAVGRYTLPTAKTAVQTARGPRGPINIEHSKQLNLPLSGGRNTGGLDETGKAMLPYIQESLKRKTRRMPFFPIGAKNVPKGLTNAGTNRGIPYSGPHLTNQEGLKRLVPLRRQGNVKEATWYQDPRTGELYQYHYGTGALARGFYKRNKNNVDIPQHARRAADEFNPNKIGARTPTNTGIMSKEREALQKLEEKIVRDDSMRNVGETWLKIKERRQIEDEINRLRKFLFDK